MKPYHLVILFVVCCLNSCRSKFEPDNTSALNELAKKYSKLYGNGLIERYKPVRKFYNNADSIEMQLLETEHSDQQIVILSNAKNDVYAIPFPDNNYLAYWGFYDGSQELPTNDNTFNGELLKAYNKLSIKEKWNKVSVFNDLMVSLLQAQPIFPSDSILIKINFEKSILADSCRVFSKNNFKSLFNNLEISIEYFNTFHDFRHNRYLQLKNMNSNSENLKITVYRQPCVVKLLYL